MGTFEEWRQISDSAFAVSDLGRIRRSDNGKIRKATIERNGYRKIRLTKAAKGLWVHRLVAEAFHGPQPGPSWQVRHLNGDSLDNRAENVAWGTASENQRDRADHGTSNRGEQHGAHKLVASQVLAIRRDTRPRKEIAAAFEISGTCVFHVKRRNTWAWLPDEVVI